MGYDKGDGRRSSDTGRYDRGDGRDRLDKRTQDTPMRQDTKRERPTPERAPERPRPEQKRRTDPKPKPEPKRTKASKPADPTRRETTGDEALEAKHGKLIAQSLTHVVRFHDRQRKVQIGARWNAKQRLILILAAVAIALFIFGNANFGLGTFAFFLAIFFGIRLAILIGQNIKADKYKHTFDLNKEAYLINGATRFAFSQIERFEISKVSKNSFVVHLRGGSYTIPVYRTAKQNEALMVSRYLAQLTQSEH